MTYVLQRTPDGGAVVSRQVLTPLSTFRDARLAEDFMAWVARRDAPPGEWTDAPGTDGTAGATTPDVAAEDRGGWIIHAVAADGETTPDAAADDSGGRVIHAVAADGGAFTLAEPPAGMLASEIARGMIVADDPWDARRYVARPAGADAPDPDDAPDRDDDEADLAALCAGGPEAADVAEDLAEDAAPVDDPSMIAGLARYEPETATTRPPAPEAAPDPYGPRGEAFARLRAGEKLGAVADDLGLAMPKLRSAWARSGERAEAPAPSRDRPVMDAIDRDAADMRRQPPALARVPERPALPEGWTECPRCRTAFNAEKARRDLRLAERPARCAACRARS